MQFLWQHLWWYISQFFWRFYFIFCWQFKKFFLQLFFWILWIFWPRIREPWNLLFLGRDSTLILKNIETHFTSLLSGLQPMCIVLFLCFDETRWEKAEKLGETPNVEVLRRFCCRDLQVTKVTTSEEKKVNNHLWSLFWTFKVPMWEQIRQSTI